MKIKDLPKNTNLRNIKLKIPENHPECPLKEGYWFSQWGYSEGKAGIWVKESINTNQVYPIFLNTLKESLEFEIIKN